MAIIFESVNYKTKAGIDLPRCNTLYEQFIADKPTQTLTDAGKAQIKASQGLTCVDIENWTDPFKYQQAMEWVSSLRRDDIGLYQQPPVRNYWAPAMHTLGEKYPQHDFRKWKAENDKRKGLAAYSSVLFPSLYTFYEDQAGWVKYAMANICEARRVAPGKPIYPFLWPQYHNSNATLKGTWIPKDYFKAQLFVCCAYADGAVIWDHQPTIDFDPAWPWWQAYTEFKAAGGLEL